MITSLLVKNDATFGINCKHTFHTEQPGILDSNLCLKAIFDTFPLGILYHNE